ncbi:hypothetical protein N7474_003707 [Penicillium riverlandense]|uniref:uncharacterized protein n=1 Tax=Penicillium riverlandense TaxID=1903569 RepID=UPI0025499A77|nr:uncharacterized protein N7474_003707 [Penicillium riverlandense]KAJ5818116.1 hypothetical protein N7474_003707 [Penicillium riverlandense]
MTTAVLAAPTTKTKRREPLRTIGMAASQAQSRPASSAAGRGRGEERRTTRLSATQQGLEGESPSHDGKRKADYEEDIGGFKFSRVSNKKPRPSLEAAPEIPAPDDAENAPPKPSPKRGRPPKKRTEEGTAVPMKGTTTEIPTRPTRGTAKAPSAEPESPSSNARSTRSRDTAAEAQPAKKKKGRPAKTQASETNGFKSPPAGTKVALPLADTPVIQRNKELRGTKGNKGRRRSSLQMRGRRASSLIDSGASNALPHREVSTADFYKHIADDGLPEPRRMRQLLIWCATRSIGEKPSGAHSEDQSARMAARVIQEELLKELESNSELSNWFGREDLNPPAVVVKRSNPRNVQNADKIKELEEQIQKLQRERQALNALLKQPSIPSIPQADPPSKLPRKPKRPLQEAEREPSIDTSLLDPSQQAILASLQPSSKSSQDASSSSPIILPPLPPSAVSTRLSRITSGLAPTLDAFAAGVHDIELYRSTADTVSSRILRICAQRLEERDALIAQNRAAIESGDGEASAAASTAGNPREDLGVILGALSRVERR